jgi:hypothetical protein
MPRTDDLLPSHPNRDNWPAWGSARIPEHQITEEAVGQHAATPAAVQQAIADFASNLGSLAWETIISSPLQFAVGLEPVLVREMLPDTFIGSNTVSVGGKLYRWDGTKYTAAVSVGDLVGLITAAHIDVDSLTAAIIRAGVINAEALAARAVTTSKMVITDFTNLAENGSFQTGTLLGWAGTALPALSAPAEISETGVSAKYAADLGCVAGYVSPVGLQMPVQEGDQFHMALRARSNSATGPLRLHAYFYDRTLTYVGGAEPANFDPAVTGWQQAGGIFAVPAGVAFVTFAIYTDAGTGTWSLTEALIRRAVNGELIVDGSITAAHLSVASLDAITADLGEVTSGLMRSPSSLAAIRLSPSKALPVGVQSFLDLAATGSAPFLKHGQLTLHADGTISWPADVRNPPMFIEFGAAGVSDPNENPEYPQYPTRTVLTSRWFVNSAITPGTTVSVTYYRNGANLGTYSALAIGSDGRGEHQLVLPDQSVDSVMRADFRLVNADGDIVHSVGTGERLINEIPVFQ